MGLDMYLTKHTRDSKSIKVGYWRKSNHIHKWFVDNCQGGVDNCQETSVYQGDIETLLAVCIDVFINRDAVEEKLPTEGGFFFGDTEYEEGYFSDVKDTIDILNKVLATTDFENELIIYQSSW
jgi:hypothetical protein